MSHHFNLQQFSHCQELIKNSKKLQNNSRTTLQIPAALPIEVPKTEKLIYSHNQQPYNEHCNIESKEIFFVNAIKYNIPERKHIKRPAFYDEKNEQQQLEKVLQNNKLTNKRIYNKLHQKQRPLKMYEYSRQGKKQPVKIRSVEKYNNTEQTVEPSQHSSKSRFSTRVIKAKRLQPIQKQAEDNKLKVQLLNMISKKQKNQFSYENEASQYHQPHLESQKHYNNQKDEHMKSERSQVKSQKLNLGLKKGVKKGKMKEWMQSILARTIIDEEITIKRSVFQPGQKKYGKNQLNIPKISHEEQQNQKKADEANQHKPGLNRVNHLKNNSRKNIILKNGQRSQTKLPNINQYQDIVEMVKKEEQRKNKKKLQKQHKEDKTEQQDRKMERMGGSIIIQQEIEYSSINNERDALKQSQTQQIKQSIKIQQN